MIRPAAVGALPGEHARCPACTREIALSRRSGFRVHRCAHGAWCRPPATGHGRERAKCRQCFAERQLPLFGGG